MFKVSGTSRLNGVTKVRYANDLTRVKILAKFNHEDIELIELPEPMEKGQAVKHLMTLPLFTDNAERASALEEANEKYNSVKKSKANLLKTGTEKVTKVVSTIKPTEVTE